MLHHYTLTGICCTWALPVFLERPLSVRSNLICTADHLENEVSWVTFGKSGNHVVITWEGQLIYTLFPVHPRHQTPWPVATDKMSIPTQPNPCISSLVIRSPSSPHLCKWNIPIRCLLENRDLPHFGN